MSEFNKRIKLKEEEIEKTQKKDIQAAKRRIEERKSSIEKFTQYTQRIQGNSSYMTSDMLFASKHKGKKDEDKGFEPGD